MAAAVVSMVRPAALVRQFRRDRETKGTVVYQEVPEGARLVGTLYVRKDAAPEGGWPDEFRVYIELTP